MALDPRLSLMVDVPNLTQAIGSGFDLGERMRNAPLLRDINQQALENSKFSAQEAKRRSDFDRLSNKINYYAQGAAQLKPMIESGNMMRANVLIAQHIDQLLKAGEDPSELKEFRDALNSGKMTKEQAQMELDGVIARSQQLDSMKQSMRSFAPVFTKDPSGKMQLSIPYFDEKTGRGGLSDVAAPEGSSFFDPLTKALSIEEGQQQIKNVYEPQRAGESARQQKIGEAAATVATIQDVEEARANAEIEASKLLKQSTAETKRPRLESGRDLLFKREKSGRDQFDKIYGKTEALLSQDPASALNYYRSQDAINAMASRDEFVNTLKLLAASEIKGQGSVTENERALLAQSASILTAPTISPDVARRAYLQAYEIMTIKLPSGGAKQSGSAQQKSQAKKPESGQRYNVGETFDLDGVTVERVK